MIVTAGAIQSPAMLLRAGIGPPAALRALGIEVAIARPGVGGNLRDHPALTFCQFLPRALRLPLSQRRASFVALRYSSGCRGVRSLRHVCHRFGPRRLASARGAAWSLFSLVQPAVFRRAGLAGIARPGPLSVGRTQSSRGFARSRTDDGGACECSPGWSSIRCLIPRPTISFRPRIRRGSSS